MAFQPVPNTALAELRYLLDNQEVENTLYLRWTSDPTETDLADAAITLFDWWYDHLRPHQVTVLQLKEIYLTPLSTETGETYSFVPTSPSYGAYVGEPEPNNVSFAIKFNTANRGRGSSGRNFALGISDDFLVQNTFNISYVNGVVGAYNALKAAILTDLPGATWVHVRRVINKILLPVGQTFPVQSATYTDLTVDSSRRRLPGRGN